MLQIRLKNSLTSNITTLYREVNGRVRYYRIKIYLTLFGEYLLVREWGGVDNKRATGEKQSFFLTLDEAIRTINVIISIKKQKGYK